MRPLEIAILCSIFAVLLASFWRGSRRPSWLPYVPSLTLALVVLHLFVEGYRWQMVPAYLLATLLFLVFLPKLGRGDASSGGSTHRWWRIGGVSLGLLCLACGSALAILLPVFQLPEPTGKFEVGALTLSMVDETRPETFTAAPDDKRELAVRVWYPASPSDGDEPVSWQENPRLGPALAQEAGLPPFVFDYFSLVRSHAYRNVPLAGRDHPVLVYSHGYGQGWASQNTSLMEELASNGYVVFSVTHTYEALITTFPEGRTVPRDETRYRTFYKESGKSYPLEKRYWSTTDPAEKAEAFEELRDATPVWQGSLDIWTQDSAFVVNELEKMDRGDGQFAGMLDTSRLGVFGHSFGGATAARFCLADGQCKAGLNMDGSQFDDPRDWKGPNPPFMMVSSGDNPGMNGDLIRHSEGPTYQLTVGGSAHGDFTDFTLVSPAFRWAGYLGRTSGAHMAHLTNAYVLAFFDRHLRSKDSRLLESGSPRYPEATLRSRNTRP